MSGAWQSLVILWNDSANLLCQELLAELEELGADIAPQGPSLVWARFPGHASPAYIDFAISPCAITVDLVEASAAQRAAAAPFLAWIVSSLGASAHSSSGVNITASVLRAAAQVPTLQQSPRSRASSR